MTEQFSELKYVLILKFYQLKFENLTNGAVRTCQITVLIVQRKRHLVFFYLGIMDFNKH